MNIVSTRQLNGRERVREKLDNRKIMLQYVCCEKEIIVLENNRESTFIFLSIMNNYHQCKTVQWGGERAREKVAYML